MKTVIFCLVIVLFSVLSVNAQGKLMNVNDVLKYLDTTKHTSAEIKKYRKTIKDKQAEGTGKVVNIIEGRRDRHKVTILTNVSNPKKGYNVVLYTTMNAPKELKTNDRIKFKGKIGRASNYKGASIDIHGTYKKTK